MRIYRSFCVRRYCDEVRNVYTGKYSYLGVVATLAVGMVGIGVDGSGL